MILVFFFFFFKQKTAYELRISDWSSDVCSSDLRVAPHSRRVKRNPWRCPERPIQRYDGFRNGPVRLRPVQAGSRCVLPCRARNDAPLQPGYRMTCETEQERSEEHTYELQSLMRISYAVFRLNKKTKTRNHTNNHTHNNI